jgi:hypothetical protein
MANDAPVSNEALTQKNAIVAVMWKQPFPGDVCRQHWLRSSFGLPNGVPLKKGLGGFPGVVKKSSARGCGSALLAFSTGASGLFLKQT